MITLTPARRRVARDLARAGTVLSAAMLVVGIGLSFGPGRQVAEAATNAGPVQVVVPPGSATAGQPLNSGGSATAFALAPPVGAACSGDSATDGYRVQTYMVPASVDPNSLTFGLAGPIPAGSGASYRQPLFTSAGSSWVNKTTAVNTGLLIGLPVLSFEWIGAGGATFVPPGTYNLGFACTLGSASATQLDKYWNVQLTFAANAADVPSGITWTVSGAPPPTTTTTIVGATTTTIVGATTTTIVGATTTTNVGATTTTTPGATTTTTAGATTTTIRSATTTTRVASGGPTGNNGNNNGNNGNTLAATGSSPMPILVWAILLMVFGRMALLLGRPLRVLPPGAS